MSVHAPKEGGVGGDRPSPPPERPPVELLDEALALHEAVLVLLHLPTAGNGGGDEKGKLGEKK